MKTQRMRKLILGVLFVVTIGLVSVYSIAQSKENKTMVYNDADVTITMDKHTSENDMKEIKDMLSEHGIKATFTEIKRNDLGELTGIKIVLQDQNGNTSASQVSGNLPIAEISFGRKDGQLYVGQNNANLNMFAFFNDGSVIPPQLEMDSIFSNRQFAVKQFNFDDFFNSDAPGLKELREQMKQFFDDEGNKKDPFAFFFDNNPYVGSTQKFRFKDDPNTNKLIIIDGKESDFTTLNSLAKDDKLETVDELQPKTAISIYGEKAKDGAIIAISKD